MFYGETITRLRATASTDRFGAAARDWSAPAELAIGSVQVQSVSSQDPTEVGRAPGVVRVRVISRPGTDLDLLRSDRVRWGGVVWLVDGDVARHKRPSTGVLHHAEAVLRRVDG